MKTVLLWDDSESLIDTVELPPLSPGDSFRLSAEEADEFQVVRVRIEVFIIERADEQGANIQYLYVRRQPERRWYIN